jgi:uncharacterized membrane protein
MDNTGLHPNNKKWRFYFNKITIVPTFLIIIYVLLALVRFDFEPENQLLIFIGRFHPLILHFPIVLILTTTAFVLMGFFYPVYKKPLIIRSLLWSSVLFSFTAIFAGYLLFVSEGYSGELVINHFYGALATGAFISICLIIYELNQNRKLNSGFGFYLMLGLANLSLAYTSHLGGSLTHGEDFLTAPLKALLPVKKVDKSPEDMLVFQDMVATVLETKCVSCHNENKSKGDLLLNNYEAVMAAGKSQKNAVVPGDTSKSELITRVMLPEGHEDRMPPEGKPGLTENEISLLTYWISSGASDSLKYGQIEDQDVLSEIEGLMPGIQQAQYKIIEEKEAFDAALLELETIGAQTGVEIEADGLSNDKYFGMKMKFPPAPVDNEALKKFSAYFPYFSRVSLASANIDDDALFFLGKMPQLRRLILQKTSINGEGLPYLKDLAYLEELNLSFAPIEDANLLHLITFKNLKKVYLFGTPVQPEVIAALQKHTPELEIILEEGPFY